MVPRPLVHGVFRRDRNEHVDMVGHQMPFLDLALATPRQFVEHLAEAPLDNPDAAASLGSPSREIAVPKKPLFTARPASYSRKRSTAFSRPGIAGGLSDWVTWEDCGTDNCKVALCCR